MSVPADEIDGGLHERLAAATLDLVNIASVSGDDTIRSAVRNVHAIVPAGRIAYKFPSNEPT